MPRYDPFDEDDLDDPELPEPDREETEDAEMIPCPSCGELVYEEAQFCAACENYIGGSSARRSPWFGIGVLTCLAVVVGWIVGC
jgi:hypothetical protein